MTIVTSVLAGLAALVAERRDERALPKLRAMILEALFENRRRAWATRLTITSGSSPRSTI